MDFSTLTQWLWDHRTDLFNATCQVIAAASFICRKTPTPDPDTWYGRLYHILLELPALNTGHAKDTGTAAGNGGAQ